MVLGGGPEKGGLFFLCNRQNKTTGGSRISSVGGGGGRGVSLLFSPKLHKIETKTTRKPYGFMQSCK